MRSLIWTRFQCFLISFLKRGESGFKEKCQEQGLPEPDFEEDYGVFTVRFYQDKWNEENLKKLGIKERQIKAVMYAKGKGKITNKEYQEINNCSRNTASNDLDDQLKIIF